MKLIFDEYLIILIFFFFALILSTLFFALSSLLVPKKFDQEKVSAYECGFNPFDDARATFDIRFYLVAILFLVFDLEISFLFPWALIISPLNLFQFWIMILFLVILTVGFIYEWYKGALEWE